MSDVELAGLAVTTLLPLLKTVGDGALEHIGGKAVGAGLQSAQGLWNALWPKAKDSPATVEAVRDVIQAPDDTLAQSALQQQLRKLLTSHPELAGMVANLRTQTTVVASHGSVAAGRDIVGSTIIGGGNTTRNGR